MEGLETGWQPGGCGRDMQDRPRGPGWSGPTYLAILPFTPFPSPITALQTHGPSHCFPSKLGFFCHRLLLHPLEHMAAEFWALELTLLSLPQGRYSVSVLVTFSTFVALGTIALKLLTVLLVVLCVPPAPTVTPKSSVSISFTMVSLMPCSWHKNCLWNELINAWVNSFPVSSPTSPFPWIKKLTGLSMST